MTNDMTGDARERVAIFLPDALARALNSYHAFSGENVPTDIKAFKEYHNACKVAIAHIDLLIKLARWADLPSADDGHDDLAAMVKNAESELADYHEKFGDDDDEKGGDE